MMVSKTKHDITQEDPYQWKEASAEQQGKKTIMHHEMQSWDLSTFRIESHVTVCLLDNYKKT